MRAVWPILAVCACSAAPRPSAPRRPAPPAAPATAAPTTTAAAGPYHDPDHRRGALPSAADRRGELAVLRDALDRMYAHRLAKLQRHAIDEDAVFAAAGKTLAAATTWAEYDAAIYGALATFRDGHLVYHPPATAAPARGYTSYHLGLDTVLARGHLLVSAVDAGSDVSAAGVAPGDEVTAIDGKPIADVLAAAATARAVSRPESALTLYAHTWTRVLVPRGDPPRARAIDVHRRATGADLHVAITPREAPAQHHEAITSTVDHDVAIVRIRSLDGGKRAAQAIDDALATARRSRGIVIDLRGDRGGVDLVGYRIVADLAEGKAPLGSYRVLVAPETLARRARWQNLVAGPDGFSAPQRLEIDAQPAGAGFHGPVAVVIDAGCVSTCEVVVSALRADLHAMLVGETTGGSSGAPVEIELPASHGKLAIPTWELITVDGHPIEDDGIAPDVDVVPTADALAAGDDLPLQTAVTRLHAQLAHP